MGISTIGCGCIPACILRQIADKLDELNKVQMYNFLGSSVNKNKQNKLMKKTLIVNSLMMTAAAYSAEPSVGYHNQWDWRASLVYEASVKDHQFSSYNAEGRGIRGELFLAKNIGIQVQAVQYNEDDLFVDELSGGFNGYLPFSKSESVGVFGHLGYLWATEGAESHNYKIGGGLFLELSKNISSRVGGYLVDDFAGKPELRFDASIGFGF